MSCLEVAKDVNEIRSIRAKLSGKVGFVPTMGALHAGHIRLIQEAKKSCDHVGVSIFVNPAQFGPSEDYASYPRSVEEDLKGCEVEGVDFVFQPSVSEIYPDGFSTQVKENQVSLPLCGKFRKDHFQGVTTVVLKLFHLIQPHVSFFGLKDIQQFFVIQKMIRDLNLDLQIVGVPTVREPDGLALSSRNQKLNDEQREKAPHLYRVLRQIRDSLHQRTDFEKTLGEAKNELKLLGFAVEYLEVLQIPELLSPSHTPNEPLVVAGAVYLDEVRLIDNVLNSEAKSLLGQT